MKYLHLIWKYKWAASTLLGLGLISFFLGFRYDSWAFIAAILAFFCGFAFPVLVADQAIKEEEEAEEEEEESLEESLLQLERDGLIQIDRSHREPEK